MGATTYRNFSLLSKLYNFSVREICCCITVPSDAQYPQTGTPKPRELPHPQQGMGSQPHAGLDAIDLMHMRTCHQTCRHKSIGFRIRFRNIARGGVYELCAHVTKRKCVDDTVQPLCR